jgi:hypothetical protein
VSTRVIHLLRCDMPKCSSQRIPITGTSAGRVRTEAKDAGWLRIHVKGGPGTPSHWADVCPSHKSGTEEQAGDAR